MTESEEVTPIIKIPRSVRREMWLRGSEPENSAEREAWHAACEAPHSVTRDQLRKERAVARRQRLNGK